LNITHEKREREENENTIENQKIKPREVEGGRKNTWGQHNCTNNEQLN
jgi:hypothetical protein